jgi:hypothetical protein
MNNRRKLFLLAGFLANQVSWYILLNQVVQELNEKAAKLKVSSEFLDLMIDKANHYAPEIFEDWEIKNYLEDYEFKKIVGILGFTPADRK